MDDWHLAQGNIGRLIAPPDDRRVAGFFAALDRINALADTSPGFAPGLSGPPTDHEPDPWCVGNA